MNKKKSDYPVNDRVIEKMNEAGMDEMALAMASGIPKATIYRIVKKEVKPNRSTVQQIAKTLNANFLYLFTGNEGELPGEGVDPWKDVALQQVAGERDRLKAEAETWKAKYDQVWSRLEFFLDRLPLGKRKPVEETTLAATG